MNRYKSTLKKIRERVPEPEPDVAERVARFVYRKTKDRVERGLDAGPTPTLEECRRRVRAFMKQKEKRDEREGVCRYGRLLVYRTTNH
jgi:hypothetical protein